MEMESSVEINIFLNMNNNCWSKNGTKYIMIKLHVISYVQQ